MCFLRRVEHRLQMVADEQTQRLPFEPRRSRASRNSAATRASTVSPPTDRSLARVERHYARLFEDAPELNVAAGNLVFTGASTIQRRSTTLRTLGFQRPEAAAETSAAGILAGARLSAARARARC